MRGSRRYGIAGHVVNSPADGTLVELGVVVGDQVNQGAVLAVVQDAEKQ